MLAPTGRGPHIHTHGLDTHPESRPNTDPTRACAAINVGVSNGRRESALGRPPLAPRHSPDVHSSGARTRRVSGARLIDFDWIYLSAGPLKRRTALNV